MTFPAGFAMPSQATGNIAGIAFVTEDAQVLSFPTEDDRHRLDSDEADWTVVRPNSDPFQYHLVVCNHPDAHPGSEKCAWGESLIGSWTSSNVSPNVGILRTADDVIAAIRDVSAPSLSVVADAFALPAEFVSGVSDDQYELALRWSWVGATCTWTTHVITPSPSDSNGVFVYATKALDVRDLPNPDP